VKIALVSSVGGHLRELMQLAPVYGQHDHFFVVNDPLGLRADLSAPTYVIKHAERDWRQIINLWEANRILSKELPDVIITTGASPAVVFGLLAKLRRIPLIYIEGAFAVEKPTLTGRIVHALGLADLFVYQWQSLSRHYPQGCYGGLIF